ncbi:MAG: GHMP kinase [Desulfitobacterium sp.]
MKGITGWARCPGSCGEWIQGAKEGIPFLIGCPINRFVEARAEILFSDPQAIEEDSLAQKGSGWLWKLPEGKEKTHQALQRFAREYTKKLHLSPSVVEIHMESQLQVGKGMASSTADMVAAVGAIAHALGTSLAPEEIANLVLAIEPSDPVMFRGVTEFAHRDGTFMRYLGPRVEAHLLMLDGGGVLDTQAFNAGGELPDHYRRNEREIGNALTLFYKGLAQNDLEKIARAGTISARCNQEINPKPFFEEFLAWVTAMGGLGVITAHSGTLLAGVFPIQLLQAEQNRILRESHQRFYPNRVEWIETCDGGLEGGIADARRQSIRSC